MKTHFIYLLLVTSTILGACTSVKKITTDNKIVIGKVDSLYSKILDEKRTIWVYTPATDNLFARKTFPVVYLLDGDAHFYSVMGMIQQLSEVNMNMVLPQMILVGITNTNRTRDLIPTGDSIELPGSGGGERFTSFLENELIPYVDAHYPTQPYRMLIGHSDGGLLCVNTLINHTKLFNGYIAIDPSMNWDNRKLLKQAEEKLALNKFDGTSFFLSIANQGYSDTDSLKDNAAAFDLAKYLDANKENHLTYRWRYYSDDNHGSVPLISEYDGLRFLFDFYNPRLPYTKFRDPSYDVCSYIVTHYKEVSDHMGYTVPPPEGLLNWLGYLFIMVKQYDKAFCLFKMNTDNYPASANVFDSMGELLLLKGDTIAAIDNYEKSLKINPGNKNAADVLKKIKNKHASN